MLCFHNGFMKSTKEERLFITRRMKNRLRRNSQWEFSFYNGAINNLISSAVKILNSSSKNFIALTPNLKIDMIFQGESM